MKFKIWDRELKFTLKTWEINYEDLVFKPEIITYWDMKDMYLKDKKTNDDFPLYFVYKNIFFSNSDEKILEEYNLNYSIIVIVPKNFQGEYSKTYGYSHSIKADWKKYQEIYEVLYWKAVYLQQNKNEVFYTIAKIWKKIIIEESFWHIIINKSNEELLITASLVNKNSKPICEEYKDLNGWNYFLLNSWWVKNPKYENKIIIKKKNNKFKWVSIYDDFIKFPKKFSFLE